MGAIPRPARHPASSNALSPKFSVDWRLWLILTFNLGGAMAETQFRNSFKLSTVMLIVIGIVLPLWPISLPFFWWLAYRSYKKGNSDKIPMMELEKAKNLLDRGVISQSEFVSMKAKMIN